MLLTVLLVGLLTSQVSVHGFTQQLVGVGPLAWMLVVLCFGVEALCSSRRIQICINAEIGFRQALRLNGWYVALVLALPARLGELATVALLHKTSPMSPGAATLSIGLQRMLDVVVMASMAVLLMLPSFDIGILLFGAGALVVILTLTLLWQLESALTLAAAQVAPAARQGRVVYRLVFRFLLQARTWYRRLPRTVYLHAVGLTLIKWTATLAGIVLLLSALLQVNSIVASGATGLFSLGSALPLHGLGGIGIGEYSLAAWLLGQGVTASAAAGAAIVLRGFIIVFGLGFFLLTRIVLDSTPQTSMPQPENLQSLYQSHRRADRSVVANSGYVLRHTFFAEQRWIQSQLGQLDGHLVLDVGCGYGLMTATAARDDERMVVGADLDLVALTQAGLKGLKPVQAEAFQLPFAANTFDVVVCTQFLNQQRPEHLQSLLETCAQLLKPGGHLLLTWRKDEALVHRLAQMLLRLVGSDFARFPQYQHLTSQVVSQARHAGLELQCAHVMRLLHKQPDARSSGRYLGISNLAVFSYEP